MIDENSLNLQYSAFCFTMVIKKKIGKIVVFCDSSPTLRIFKSSIVLDTLIIHLFHNMYAIIL